MFVNTLTQKTAGGLDAEAHDHLETTASWVSDTVQIYQSCTETADLNDHLSSFDKL